MLPGAPRSWGSSRESERPLLAGPRSMRSAALGERAGGPHGWGRRLGLVAGRRSRWRIRVRAGTEPASRVAAASVSRRCCRSRAYWWCRSGCQFMGSLLLGLRRRSCASPGSRARGAREPGRRASRGSGEPTPLTGSPPRLRCRSPGSAIASPSPSRSNRRASATRSCSSASLGVVFQRGEGLQRRPVPGAEEVDELLAGAEAERERPLLDLERRDPVAEELAQVRLGAPEHRRLHAGRRRHVRRSRSGRARR